MLQKHLKSILSYCLFTSIILFTFEFLTQHSGWPGSHDGITWKYRVVSYYFHFKQFDFLPLWSSGDCFGLGSPLPLYYHRLFNYVAVLFLLITKNIKIVGILTLVTFAVIGLVGIRKCLSLFNLDFWLSTFITSCFLLLNYIGMTWAVRGAVAEYSSIMILPYLIHWNINLLLHQKFNLSLVPILILLYLAHNVIALYGVYLCLFTLLFSLAMNFSSSTALHYLNKSTLATTLFFLLISPLLIPMKLLSDYYDVSKIINGMSVDLHFQEFLEYFYDKNYSWDLSTDSFSVELNPILWITMFLLFFVGIYQLIKNKAHPIQSLRTKYLFIYFTLLMFSFMFLQTPASYYFYKLVPGAIFIQFPWRLLSFIQIIALIFIAFLISILVQSRLYQRLISSTILIVLMLSYPYFWTNKNRNWAWYDERTTQKFVNDGVWGTGGEYIPRVKNFKHYESWKYEQIAKRCPELIDANSGTIEAVHFENPESLMREFIVTISEETTMIIPINYSGLEEIYFEGDKKKPVIPFRIDEDPRIRIKAPIGSYKVIVHLPTISTCFRKLFH